MSTATLRVTTRATLGLVAMSIPVVAGSAAPSSPEPAQAAYHILVTNDDGIESPGIQTLAGPWSADSADHAAT